MNGSVIIEIPGVEMEQGDDTEAIFEQIVAIGLAEYGIDYDGAVRAERLPNIDWEPYEPCPECGSERFREASHTFGIIEACDGDISYADYDHIDNPSAITCDECGVLLYDTVEVRPE